eukprot:1699265-Pleurochrysis_carterae.AAC.1
MGAELHFDGEKAPREGSLAQRPGQSKALTWSGSVIWWTAWSSSGDSDTAPVVPVRERSFTWSDTEDCARRRERRHQKDNRRMESNFRCPEGAAEHGLVKDAKVSRQATCHAACVTSSIDDSGQKRPHTAQGHLWRLQRRALGAPGRRPRRRHRQWRDAKGWGDARGLGVKPEALHPS